MSYQVPGASARAGITFDRLGATLSTLTLIALVLLPVVTLQPNRILPGEGVELEQLARYPTFMLFLGLLILTLTGVTVVSRHWIRLGLATLTLLALVVATGSIASPLLDNRGAFARLALGSGFWAIGLLLGLMMTDAVVKMGLSARWRLVIVTVCLGAIVSVLSSGLWDHLSLMLEYRNQERFWAQGGRHLLLAFGSVLPALLIGVPLGIGCHRSAALRTFMIPLLSLLQTIPSLAMFGLLMIPLTLLTQAFPVLNELGIRGIGAAPAVLALFLYSLLPIVSNTAAGFDGLNPAVIDAARGMGMNARQRLWQVQLPLALPVMLSGLRIVVTMNIGLVAVAGLIGGGGYGTYIFQGLGQTATDLVLLGTLPTIVLAFVAALVIDTLIEFSRKERG
ncbi:ABC transporter permease [Marinobacterium litorale]|uniref:ABC transporter permease n=1 Tax=Marinobacterium litorale TaxID=404770 RepID=UPI001B7FA276|nr:ABC transporter permease [Marinobacterium litorale]